MGSTFSNCCKFNVGQFSLCYLDYDICGVFFGITHKVKLKWQVIIVLYYGHMQGELKSSLNFMTFFKIIMAFQKSLMLVIEGML